MKVLTKVGDRLLGRFVPRATAAADECQWVYDCYANSGCSSNYGKRRRMLCANAGWIGSWDHVGCC